MTYRKLEPTAPKFLPTGITTKEQRQHAPIASDPTTSRISVSYPEVKWLVARSGRPVQHRALPLKNFRLDERIRPNTASTLQFPRVAHIEAPTNSIPSPLSPSVMGLIEYRSIMISCHSRGGNLEIDNGLARLARVFLLSRLIRAARGRQSRTSSAGPHTAPIIMAPNTRRPQ